MGGLQVIPGVPSKGLWELTLLPSCGHRPEAREPVIHELKSPKLRENKTFFFDYLRYFVTEIIKGAD